MDLSGLDDGRAAFARHAAAGLPSNQVFTAAKQKINGVISRVSEQLGAAWSQWTAERMAGLPLVRIPLARGADEQARRRTRRDDLLKLSKDRGSDRAGRRPVSTRLPELLRETLGQVSDPPRGNPGPAAAPRRATAVDAGPADR